MSGGTEETAVIGRTSALLVRQRVKEVVVARIALIDGDPELVALMQEFLKDAGHDVTAYVQPEDVVDQLADNLPHLVILDPWLKSPTDGWEILASLRLDRRTRKLPIIVYSAAVDHLQSKAGWLRESRIPSLRKPFELRELEQLIDGALTG